MFFMVNKNKTNQFLLDCKLVRYCNTERFRSEFRTKVFVLNVLLFLALSLNKNGKYCGAFPTRVVMVNLFRGRSLRSKILRSKIFLNVFRRG